MNRGKKQIGKVVPIHARHYVEVSDQPYAPTAFPGERSLTYSDSDLSKQYDRDRPVLLSTWN